MDDLGVAYDLGNPPSLRREHDESQQVFVVPGISKDWQLKDWDCPSKNGDWALDDVRTAGSHGSIQNGPKLPHFFQTQESPIRSCIYILCIYIYIYILLGTSWHYTQFWEVENQSSQGNQQCPSWPQVISFRTIQNSKMPSRPYGLAQQKSISGEDDNHSRLYAPI